MEDLRYFRCVVFCVYFYFFGYMENNLLDDIIKIWLDLIEFVKIFWYKIYILFINIDNVFNVLVIYIFL